MIDLIFFQKAFFSRKIYLRKHYFIEEKRWQLLLWMCSVNIFLNIKLFSDKHFATETFCLSTMRDCCIFKKIFNEFNNYDIVIRNWFSFVGCFSVYKLAFIFVSWYVWHLTFKLRSMYIQSTNTAIVFSNERLSFNFVLILCQK